MTSFRCYNFKFTGYSQTEDIKIGIQIGKQTYKGIVLHMSRIK